VFPRGRHALERHPEGSGQQGNHRCAQGLAQTTGRRAARLGVRAGPTAKIWSSPGRTDPRSIPPGSTTGSFAQSATRGYVGCRYITCATAQRACNLRLASTSRSCRNAWVTRRSTSRRTLTDTSSGRPVGMRPRPPPLSSLAARRPSEARSLAFP